MNVDLNADLGERESVTGEDLAVLDSVSSVSIACGFHAGSPEVMRGTALACFERGVVVGAHVSYRDRKGFGRRSIDLDPDVLFEDVVEQYETLDGALGPLGIPIAYVKPHGALYNDMVKRPQYASAVIRAMHSVGSGLLVAQDLGLIRVLAGELGVRLAAEGFPDRGYLADGRLAPRRSPGGVVDDPDEAASRAVSLATLRRVKALDGTPIDVAVDTLCVHGDAERAGMRAARVPRRSRGGGGCRGPPRCRLSRPASVEVPPGEVVPFGDRGLVVGTSDHEAAHTLSASLIDLPGVLEVCPGMRSVVVLLDGPPTGGFIDLVQALSGTSRPDLRAQRDHTRVVRR